MQDLLAFVEGLGVRSVDLVAWSYSGEIGTKAALERSDLFRTIVHYEPIVASLLDGVPGSNVATAEMFAHFGPAMGAVKDGDTETAALRFVEAVFKWPEGQAEDEPEAWQAIWRLNGRTLPVQFASDPGVQLSCADASAVAVPTLVVEGVGTFARYAMMVERLASCQPNAVIRVMEGVGHDGPYERPEDLARMILNFTNVFGSTEG